MRIDSRRAPLRRSLAVQCSCLRMRRRPPSRMKRRATRHAYTCRNLSSRTADAAEGVFDPADIPPSPGGMSSGRGALSQDAGEMPEAHRPADHFESRAQCAVDRSRAGRWQRGESKCHEGGFRARRVERVANVNERDATIASDLREDFRGICMDATVTRGFTPPIASRGLPQASVLGPPKRAAGTCIVCNPMPNDAEASTESAAGHPMLVSAPARPYW